MQQLMSAVLLAYVTAMMLHMCPADGVKILLVPSGMNSHVLYFRRLAVDLARLGHVTNVLVPSNVRIPSDNDNDDVIRSNATQAKCQFTATVYPVASDETFSSSRVAGEILASIALTRSPIERFWSTMEFYRSNYASLERDCVDLLENRRLVDEVRAGGYQFAIMDLLAMHCYYALPYAAEIPYATMTIGVLAAHLRVPRLLSASTLHPVGAAETGSFVARLFSFLNDIVESQAMVRMPTEFIERYAPGKPVLDTIGLIRNATMWFYLEDIAVGRAVPTMPNTIAIGDLMAGRKGRPLPAELEAFVGKYAGGFVVVSMGSFFENIPDDVIAKFCDAFRRLPTGMSVIWKFGNSTACSLWVDQIHFMPWIPQNDLLADRRVRLFVTHAGLNSIVESVSHGVPVVCFPIVIDQEANADAAVANGYGVRMDLGDFDADRLLDAMDRVLTDPAYRLNAQRAAAIMRDRSDTPAERVSRAIDHVLKYGVRHLRTAALEMNLVQYLMFDIFAFLFTVFIMLCLFVVLFCRLVVRRCYRHDDCLMQKSKLKSE